MTQQEGWKRIEDAQRRIEARMLAIADQGCKHCHGTAVVMLPQWIESSQDYVMQEAWCRCTRAVPAVQ